MILWSEKNSTGAEHRAEILKENYIKINIILAGVILLIFVYSGFFSPEKNNYPVVCIHEKLTGEPCVSCGLSHSFSLILRGRIREAGEWNPYGFRIFLFFALQLVMRGVFSVVWIRNSGIRKEVVIYDIAASLIIFLIAFLPFIRYILHQSIQ